MKAVAIILNFFIPGVGSLVIGKTGALTGYTGGAGLATKQFLLALEARAS